MCYGQTYNFHVYNEDDGLAQSYVYEVSQAKNGFIKVSTGEGFCSFDGSKFRTFSTKNGLAENNVITHFTDTKGRTWIGHFQNGVSCLEGDTAITIKGTEELQSKVLSFVETKDGTVYFGTQTSGIYFIKDNNIVKLGTSNDLQCVSKIVITPNNQFLIASNNGLYLYNKSGNKLNLVSTLVEATDSDVKQIVLDKENKGTVWALINNVGLVELDYSNSRLLTKRIFSNELKLMLINLTSLYIDNDRNIWIGTIGQGVRKIVFNRQKLNYSIEKYAVESGFPTNDINTIFQDFEGNMWFGTFGSGLIELPVDRFQYFEVERTDDFTGVKSILSSNRGLVLVGFKEGLMTFEKNNPEVKKVYSKFNGFINDEVKVIKQKDETHFFIGTLENGLFLFDAETEKFENLTKKFSISGLSINDILFDKVTSQLVVGSTDGLCIIDYMTGKTKFFTTIEGLLHNNVGSLYRDSKNRIWICSYGTPPYYYFNNSFITVGNIPNLKTFNINSVTEDSNYKIWIATEGDGVFKLDYPVVNFRIEDGLLSNYAYFINHDEEGKVWVSHKNGISSIDGNTNKIKVMTKQDGLLFAEIDRRSSFEDAEGNLWFGAENGVIKLNSSKMAIKFVEPITSILNIKFNETDYDLNSDIYLKAGNYNVKIDFISVSHTNPGSVTYMYRLLGQDTAWRTTKMKHLEFPKLREGDFVFQLRAVNGEGVWNKEIKEIRFSIDEPFWKKWWFIVLVVIAVIVLTTVIIRLRTKKVIEDKIRLEKLVDEKTALLQAEKSIVESVKAELEQKNRDVTDSINYALRIQQSVLPEMNLLRNRFKKAFVYYEPRDIVSGDFYWFTETQNSFIIAAVDCTGHGIPGAFMSLIGSTLLNDIVVDKKIETPSDILKVLNNTVYDVLKQYKEDTSNDGMDMVICNFSKTDNSLVFSGANRPLYHLRNGVLNDYKGIYYSIGGQKTSEEKTFTDKTIQLESNDSIFIFSDGYGDQFGGGSNKKFSTRQMKQMFVDMNDLDETAQLEKVKNAFQNWKGSYNQVDDILLIGMTVK